MSETLIKAAEWVVRAWRENGGRFFETMGDDNPRVEDLNFAIDALAEALATRPAQPEPRAAGTEPERTWQETPELLRICGGCKDPAHDCHLNAGARERIAKLREYMRAIPATPSAPVAGQGGEEGERGR